MQDDTITQPTGNGQDTGPTTILPPAANDGWRSFFSFVAIIISAILIAVCLIQFIFQSYQVEGSSMERTLQNGDRLIVLKTGRTWARLTRDPYLPKRGEIVVFHRSDAASRFEGEDKQLIKRVVALPGERVVIRDGVLTVYNNQFPNGFQPDNQGDYTIASSFTSGEEDEIVPSGHVYVMGDNRGNSRDSRDLGPIPSREIVGNLALRIFPLNKFDSY